MPNRVPREEEKICREKYRPRVPKWTNDAHSGGAARALPWSQFDGSMAIVHAYCQYILRTGGKTAFPCLSAKLDAKVCIIDNAAAMREWRNWQTRKT
jgi:hypothetical protein